MKLYLLLDRYPKLRIIILIIYSILIFLRIVIQLNAVSSRDFIFPARGKPF